MSEGRPDVDKMRMKRDVKGLIKALSYKEIAGGVEVFDRHYVREFAAKALGEIRDKQAVKPLLEFIKERGNYASSRSEIATARKALVDIGAPAVEPLIAAINSNDILLRREAGDALRYITDTGAFEPLTIASKDKDTFLSTAASEALQRIQRSSGAR